MTQFNRRRLIDLNDLQQIALPPNVVTLPVQELTGRLALLLSELLLLALDPRQFRDRKDAHCVQAHALRRRDAHTASRRMHAEMDVLDVLTNNVHINLAKLQSRAHQYSGCALI